MPDSSILWWGNHALISGRLPRAKAIKINADGNTFAALLADGQVRAWENRMGNASGNLPATPSNPVVDIANGGAHILALHKDSTISCSNKGGVRALDACPKLTGVVSISASYFQSGAMTSDGTITTWGIARASSVMLFPGDTIVQFHVAQSGNLAVTKSHTLHAWNAWYNGIVIDSIHASDVTMIGAGWQHSLVLHGDGRVTARGKYAYKDAYVPAGLSNVKKLIGGNNYSAALLGNGSVVVWGDSLLGSSLAAPDSLTDVVDIAGDYDEILALKRDGTVVAWGGGSTPDNLVDIAAVSPKAAVKKDGSLRAWAHSGIVTPEGNDFIAVSSVERFSMALRKNGTVVTWPYYSRDTLLDVPPNLTDVVAIAAGYAHALALKRDGSVVAWGENSGGQTNMPKDFKARAIVAGNNTSWLLRDTTNTTVSRQPATPRPSKAFEAGMYQVHGMDGTLLWKGELRNPSELSRLQSRGRILVLRRVSSGDVLKTVNF